MGLPFAFASHFAPAYLMTALRLYRNLFKPSAQLLKPYVMVGVNVIAAKTDEEARFQFTSLQQSFTLLLRGITAKLPPPPPVENSVLALTANESGDETLLFC